MGCCNKTLEGEPIGALRYWAGTAVIAGVHGGLLAFLTVAGRLVPRYRRVLPFYRAYARETLAGILRRERIWRVGDCRGNPECELRP
jgi:hypothetical protein